MVEKKLVTLYSRNGRWLTTVIVIVLGSFLSFPSSHVILRAAHATLDNTSNDALYSLESQWGEFGALDGQLKGPSSIALSSSGEIYVADTGNHRVQKFTSEGEFMTKWGSFCDIVEKGAQCADPDGTDGPLSLGDGQFNTLAAIAVDGQGNIYSVDSWNHRVQKFTSEGEFMTKWGSFGSGDGEFIFPSGIAVGQDGSSVYVVSEGDGRVQKFTSEGKFMTKWGSFGSGDGEFCGPHDIETDLFGNVYVEDSWNHRVQKFTSEGKFMTKWGIFTGREESTSKCQSQSEAGMAIDSAANNIIVVDPVSSVISIFTSDGKLIAKDSIGERFEIVAPWDLAIQQ